jgi:hypothetical protein
MSVEAGYLEKCKTVLKGVSDNFVLPRVSPIASYVSFETWPSADFNCVYVSHAQCVNLRRATLMQIGSDKKFIACTEPVDS